MYVYSALLHWVYILVIEGCFNGSIVYKSLYVSFHMPYFPCVYLIMYFMCERRVTFS